MLPLKLLKKQPLALVQCLKRSNSLKDLQQCVPAAIEASCHEAHDDHGTIGVATSYWKQHHQHEGVLQPAESIEHIIAHVIGKEDCRERCVDDIQLEKLQLLCDNRLKKAPLEYITGEGDESRDVKSIRLSQTIFIPESQTEVLVDLLLKHIAQSCSSVCGVLEIGCGVGAVSLSLAKSCDCGIKVVAIDTNLVACELTRHNAQKLGIDPTKLAVLHATLQDDGVIEVQQNLPDDDESTIDFESEQFDFIVSNPPCTPYSQLADWRKENKNIRDAGEDGLRVVRAILLNASTHLKVHGVLLLEIFAAQTKLVESIIEENYASQFKLNHVYVDLKSDKEILEIINRPQ
ncbi:hemK methyltransferase family member 1-like isoform X1 [Trichogramma pretiosum]|uniref:hemK methyltransferase family member 1-like isoform X1 n=1 Tax=Trichogramma pretiosum TaxID=7493 RepID=UPI0006C975C8|nr:hemK methyltransferase family member 1-like isoform X1 [Trichogramma pretiosum]